MKRLHSKNSNHSHRPPCRQRGDFHLGTAANGRQISIPAEAFKYNVWLTGPPGTGKSVLLESLALDRIIKGYPIIFLDKHGDAAQHIFNFCSNFENLAKKVILFDPLESDFILGFNPIHQQTQLLSERKAHLTMAVQRYMNESSQETPRLTRWLNNVFEVLLKNEMTFAESRYLCALVDNPYRQELVKAVEGTNVGDEWQWFAKLRPAERANQLESTLNRLVSFTGSERLYLMLGSKQNVLDINDLIDNNKILLLDISQRGALGENDSNLLASLILHETIAAARARDNRKDLFIFCDEVHRYISRLIGDSFCEDRKHRLRWIIAHQSPGQIREVDPYIFSCLNAGAQNRIVFPNLPWAELEEIEKDFFAGMHNLCHVKDETWIKSVVDYLEETRIIHSTSRGSTTVSSWFSSAGEGESQTVAASQGQVRTTGSQISDTMTPANDWWVDPTVTHSEGLSESIAEQFNETQSQTKSRNFSSGEGGADGTTETEGESVVPFLKPIFGYQRTGRQFYNLEEERYTNICKMKNLPQQHAMVKILNLVATTVKIRTMNVTNPATPEKVEQFKQTMFAYHECFAKTKDREKEIKERHQSLIKDAVAKATKPEAVVEPQEPKPGQKPKIKVSKHK